MPITVTLLALIRVPYLLQLANGVRALLIYNHKKDTRVAGAKHAKRNEWLSGPAKAGGVAPDADIDATAAVAAAMHVGSFSDPVTVPVRTLEQPLS